MKIINIDGKLIKSKLGIHKFLKNRINDDAYIGNNLDALYDVLSNYSEKLKFNMYNLKYVNNELAPYVNSLIKTFEDLVAVNENIEFEIINEIHLI